MRCFIYIYIYIPLVHRELERTVLFADALPVGLLRRQPVHMHDDAVLHVLEKVGDGAERRVLGRRRRCRRVGALRAGRRRGAVDGHRRAHRARLRERERLEDENVATLQLDVFEDTLERVVTERIELHLLVHGELLRGVEALGVAQDREEVVERVVDARHVRACKRELLSLRIIVLEEEEDLPAEERGPSLVLGGRGRLRRRRRERRARRRDHFQVEAELRLELVALPLGRRVLLDVHHRRVVVKIELERPARRRRGPVRRSR